MLYLVGLCFFMCVLLWLLFSGLYERVFPRMKTIDRRYQRSPVFLCDDQGQEPKKEPKKIETREEKQERIAKEKERKSPATLLKRAQIRITEFIEESERAYNERLRALTVLYGRDEDDQVDLRVFAEFHDKALGIYYASVDPKKDSWVLFDHDGVYDLFAIVERQKNR